MIFIKQLCVVGTTTKFSETDLPLQIYPIFSDGECFYEKLVENPVFKDQFSSLSKEELEENGIVWFSKPMMAKSYACLFQTGMNEDPAYVANEQVATFLAQLGNKAMGLAGKAIIAENEVEAEKQLWYAARCFPKENVAAILALRFLLKGKVTAEELAVLDRKLIDDK